MTVEGANVVLVRRAAGIEVTGERVGDLTPTLQVPTGLHDLVLDVARSWGWLDATADGRPFRFVTTHTEAYDEGIRNAQRDALLAAVGDPEVPVMLVGDFNAPPATVGMPASYLDAWLAAGNDPAAGLTCGQAADLANPESTLARRIDYVFVRDAPVLGCRVIGDQPADRTRGGLWPSDHAGVVAEVGL
jgi:endonuclease/exonuclease/phosphatase family metal-dependent hydrolase